MHDPVPRQLAVLIPIAGMVLLGLVSGRASGQTCQGDCNSDGTVSIDELVVLVTVALGSRPPSACTAGDANGDGTVRVSELVGAVKAALDGCPVPTGDVAAAALAVARGLAQLPGLSEVVAGALDSIGHSQTCELGGELDSTCEDSGTGTFLTAATAKHCRIATVEGIVESTGTADITASGQCPDQLLPLDVQFVFAMDAVTERTDGAPLIDARVDATVTLTSLLMGPPPCSIKGGVLTVDGPIVYHGPGSRQVKLQFDQASVTEQFLGFQGSCDPIAVVATADGSVRIDDTYGDGPFGLTATLNGLAITVHRDTHTLELDGEVASACFGGAARLQTAEPLAYPLDQPCFAGGTLAVGVPSGTTEVSIATDGNVQVRGASDTNYASCLDLPRHTCE